ncbi:MAG TPA: sigma-54 dependent transcriptional regulator [Polyangiaceae bacterium]|jgi:DNA-binding NtrC family response regulator
MSTRVLIVDDEREMGTMLRDGLRGRGYDASCCGSSDVAFAEVMDARADVVITDIRMPNMNGIELCDRIVANRPDVPVAVMTAFGDLQTAIATIRAGAFDFLAKPFDIDDLVLVVERAINQRTLREEVKRLRMERGESNSSSALLGESAALRSVARMIQRVADTDSVVLVTGETGTGKELVARAIHEQSRRRDGTFVAINCGALPDALLESELFGHVRGAFTDARENRTGLFAEASGGTLLLDEIGDMQPSMQVKLLRALETRTVRPVGSNVEVPFDARIIAATHRDLDTAVEEGRFREDLLYRLNVIPIELPPLRGRGGDVLVLAQHFLDRFSQRADKKVRGLSQAVAERLLSYAWPGNVRELQNAIERAVALAQHEQIVVEDLPAKIRDYRRSHVIVTADDPEELVSMEEVERRYVARVLESAGGNKNFAARILGWDRKTLYRRLERWSRRST